jgi:alpha-ketoglutarate-dependent taurine dioxygenase
MAQLTIRPVNAAIGAEITGVDFRKPVQAEMREALSKALSEHLALGFPTSR